MDRSAHEIQLQRRVVAEAPLADIVQILAPDDAHVRRAKDMIESTPDAERPARHVPAEILPTVAVKMAVGIDEDPLRTTFHHAAFGEIPPTPVNALAART